MPLGSDKPRGQAEVTPKEGAESKPTKWTMSASNSYFPPEKSSNIPGSQTAKNLTSVGLRDAHEKASRVSVGLNPTTGRASTFPVRKEVLNWG